MKDLAPIKRALVEADMNGKLIDCLIKLESRVRHLECGPILCQLHNLGQISLVSEVNLTEISKLEHNDFWMINHPLDQAISGLKCSHLEILEFVGTLVKKAGSDGAAGMPNQSLIQWCSANPQKAEKIVAGTLSLDQLCIAHCVFAIQGLGDLLDALLSRAKPIHHPTKVQVDIQTACKKTVTGAADIVDLIVSRKLKFVGYDPQKGGYLSVLVDANEVAKLMRLEEPKGFMKHEIVSFLGVNDPAIKYLETSGLLPFVKSRHPISRKTIRIVSYDAMAAFLREYLPCKYLAKSLNLSTRHVGSKLDSKDADRIEMPSNCRGEIYRRDGLFSKLNDLDFFISTDLDVFHIGSHDPISVYNQ